jgi:hypothetical protein
MDHSVEARIFYAVPLSWSARTCCLQGGLAKSGVLRFSAKAFPHDWAARRSLKAQQRHRPLDTHTKTTSGHRETRARIELASTATNAQRARVSHCVPASVDPTVSIREERARSGGRRTPARWLAPALV